MRIGSKACAASDLWVSDGEGNNFRTCFLFMKFLDLEHCVFKQSIVFCWFRRYFQPHWFFEGMFFRIVL